MNILQNKPGIILIGLRIVWRPRPVWIGVMFGKWTLLLAGDPLDPRQTKEGFVCTI